jgi:amino acid transporter
MDVTTHKATPPPIAQRSTSRVTSTLAKSRLGVASVAFFALAGVAPLMVAAGVVTAAYAITGLKAIPVAFVAIGLILAVFVRGYMAMSRRIASAGAFYTFISRGLGRVPGVGGAAVALMAYNLLQVSLYGAWGVVVSGYTEARFGWHIAWWGWALMAWLVVAILGLLRIDLNAKVLATLTVAEVLLVLVLDGVMVGHPAGGQVTFTTLDPRLLFATGMSAAFVVAISGFVGFESTVVLSEETSDRIRTTPRATYITLGLATLVYASSAWAMSVATGPDNIAKAAGEQSSDLIFNLSAPHVPAVMLDAGHLLFCTSVFAAMLSFHNTVARYLFSLGRERVLPGTLGYASPASGAPVVGSLVQTLIGLVAIFLFSASGWDPFIRMFFWLGTTGGLGVLLLMIATCISVVVFFLRNPDGETVWSRLIAPILSGIALAVIAFQVIDQYEVLLGVDPHDTVVWAFPAAYGVVTVLGILWALALRTMRQDRYRAIGRGSDA